MKFKTVLIFIAISMLHISCGSEQGFSVDRCTGDYFCTVEGQTMLILPSGRADHPKPVPVTNYPDGTKVTVTKTGNSELTLTLSDRTLVAQVDENGKLTIPDTNIYLENEYFTMSLTASYTVAYITSDMLYIKQVATGLATCDDRGDRYTLTVTNTQFFDGERK